MPFPNDWGLNEDPFPHAGHMLKPESPGHRNLYLDFYEWKDAGLIAGLGASAELDIQRLRNLQSAVTVLISGVRGSGRSSIKNLLVFELARAPSDGALVLELTPSLGSDRVQPATQLAMRLIHQARERDPEAGAKLQSTMKMWMDLSGAASDPTVLLQLLRDDVQSAFPGLELIVVIDASNHNLTRDTARATNAMLREFATYVIMSLTDADDALFMRDEVATERVAAWVNAPKVDALQVKTYVARQLAARRQAAALVGPIFPFEDAAIDHLFRATSAPGQEKITIKVALEKLSGALKAKANAPGAPPCAITEADMQAFLG